jgi:MinD-like ATPase involved in chromosome partitioning or flagellar assembly
VSLNGSSGYRQVPPPDHLYTWIDIDRFFADLEIQGLWPEWLFEIDAYWHGVQIVVADGAPEAEVWHFLAAVFGPLTIDRSRRLILLDATSMDSDDRTLSVEIEHAQSMAEPDRRPRWAGGRVVARFSTPLTPSSDDAFPAGTTICAFHSFKGGVGRTLHCVATATALAGLGRRVLLIDADLEAPGITWMWRAQALRQDFTFEDFLALVHGSTDEPPVDAIELGAKFLANQEVDGVIVMPARRDSIRFEPIRIEPTDLLTPDRDPFVLTATLAALGRRIGADVILVDLRAGISELNAPLLLDPRVHRVIVSTISDQSVRGSLQILAELGRRAPARVDSDDPDVTLVLTQFNERDHQERLSQVAADLSAMALNVSGVAAGARSEADITAPIVTSRFDPQLLNLGASWNDVRAAAAAAQLDRALAPLTRLLSPMESKAGRTTRTPVGLEATRQTLASSAKRLVFAETSDTRDFLVTEPLDNLAESHRTQVPIETVIGAKGSGKTFTFLQVCTRRRWSDFVNEVSGRDNGGTAGGCTPGLAINPANLSPERESALRDQRSSITEELGTGRPAEQSELRDLIRLRLRTDADELSWRHTWLTCFARSVGLETTPEEAQTALTRLAREHRVLFVVDGLEDLFQDFIADPRQQLALRALLTECGEWLRTLRQRPLGLLTFVRRDLAQVAVTQNFAQFEARHGNYALRWNRVEALRLAAWICQRGGAFDGTCEISEADAEELSGLMLPIWGDKMGSPRSREARSEQWFFAALSDFSAQIQARDVVTFLAEAAEGSIRDPNWPSRILAPSAMRKALPECSRQKIDAIAQENRPVGEILKGLQNLPDEHRKVPFTLESVNLTPQAANLLETNGVLFREDDQYWIPEIFRHGLNFRATGRPRILAIANLVRRRND